ncbi:YkgJ family cysteine cluster protein [Fusibacter bizertensis]
MSIKLIVDKINTSSNTSEEYIQLLKPIYHQIPTGTCEGCANCCSESVNVSLIELANIIKNGIGVLPAIHREQLNKRLIAFYLTEWVKSNPCPFLDEDKKCLIYEVRPLPCRIFGTPTEDAYASNYRNIKKQNLTFAKTLYSFEGIKLSADVLAKKIEFCNQFDSESKLTTDEIDALYSQLINLDGKLYFNGVIDEPLINGDLVNWTLEYIIEAAREERKENPVKTTHDRVEQGLSKKFLYDVKVAISKALTIK